MEVVSGQVSGASLGIDLIHDTRHLCTRIKIDIGTNAMSRSIAGCKQAIKFSKISNSNRVSVWLFSLNE